MIALIPARGDSKGLPNKNIKLLMGKPLIAYSIQAALNSLSIDEVYVSTDSPEIARIAKSYGAKVPFLRPKELASDEALAIDTYIYMISEWTKMGLKVDNFLILQPTSPLRTSINIDEAVKLFHDKKADSVLSYTKENHPISWHKKVNKDLSFSSIFEDKLENRQEVESTYYPNGAIYIFNTKLIQQKKYYSDKSYAYIMDKKDSLDIDYIDDFEYAEFLLMKKIKND